MKKVILGIAFLAAISFTANVNAQDDDSKKKECTKTEKACTAKKSKECTKKTAKACTKSAEKKKCCKTDAKKASDKK